MLGYRCVAVPNRRELVAGNALAFVEYLDRRTGDVGIDNLAGQLRWHRVIVAANLVAPRALRHDLINRCNAGPLPFGKAVSLLRQRTKGWAIKGLQKIVPALAEAAHDFAVDGGHARADRQVQLRRREEALITQLRQHEAFDNLNRHFDLEGLAEDANPYSLRHTVARWLRAESVPVWEVAALLGHKMPGHNVTEMYAAADPQHMLATKQALDKILRAGPKGETT